MRSGQKYTEILMILLENLLQSIHVCMVTYRTYVADINKLIFMYTHRFVDAHFYEAYTALFQQRRHHLIIHLQCRCWQLKCVFLQLPIVR